MYLIQSIILNSNSLTWSHITYYLHICIKADEYKVVVLLRRGLGGWLLTGYHLSVLFSATFVYLDYQTYGEYRATPESFNEPVGIV
jgi:hypothetical protein